LQLDINTSQHFQEEISQAQLTEISQELVNLGKEIAGKGDVP
jgi:hypothetical protein